MKFSRLPLLAFAIILTCMNLHGQDPVTKDGYDAFFFDAIVVKGRVQDSARVDCYALVPYASLMFSNSQSGFSNKYQLILSAFDSLGNIAATKSVVKTIYENDYAASQGGTAKFASNNISFQLKPGSYKIKATLIDENAREEYFQSRTITIINYSRFPISMSALMLVSSIEEVGGKYKITPHLSDNIAILKDGFFAFFELYNQLQPQELDFMYQFFEGDKLIASGKKIRKNIETGINQVYLRVQKPQAVSSTGFILRVLALSPNETEDFAEFEIKAAAQRSIKSITRMGGIVLSDLPKAIKQLRYVANQDDISHISQGENDSEKIKRFEAFWKNLDPTPTTERNEAFDEYFKRIAYANKNFKSYTEGWMTDKGMVYIVYGQPMNIERFSPYNDGRTYERWDYDGNREFIFGDNSGFGDFRLVRPISVIEKYKYDR